MPLDTAETKECSKCKRDLARSEFYSDKNKKDGLYPSCKACKAIMQTAWQRSNPEKIAAYTKKCKQKYPERYFERRKKYAEANREKLRAASRNWVEKNRDKLRIKVRMANAKRRAGGARKNSPFVISKLMVLQRARCAVCASGIATRYHVDHIFPLSLGGGNEPENLQLLCPPCNIQKRDMHPVAFMQKRGFLI